MHSPFLWTIAEINAVLDFMNERDNSGVPCPVDWYELRRYLERERIQIIQFAAEMYNKMNKVEK